eukprot:6013212-Pyramimonas_sp.AAC.1
MLVLTVDDYLVPEAFGFNARAQFLQLCVLTFTSVSVYLRAVNREPNWDYFFFLFTLTFDYMLLSSFTALNEYADPTWRVLMVRLPLKSVHMPTLIHLLHSSSFTTVIATLWYTALRSQRDCTSIQHSLCSRRTNVPSGLPNAGVPGRAADGVCRA